MSITIKDTDLFINGTLALQPAPGISGLADKGGQVFNPLAYGALGDGATDDSAALSALFTTVSAAGGGIVWFPPGKTFKINSTVVLKSNVALWGHGATVQWGGSAAGTMFESDLANALYMAGVHGLTIDPTTGANAAGMSFKLHTAKSCRFEQLRFLAGSNTLINIGLYGDAATDSDTGSRNSVFNTFAQIRMYNCGTGVEMAGAADGSTHITLNVFREFFMDSVRTFGYNLIRYVDTNWWYGVRISLAANNAVGVVHNSWSPASNVGVYSNNFHGFAITPTGSGVTGTIGHLLNNTHQVHCHDGANGIPTAMSLYSISSNASSYWLEDITSNDNNTTTVYQKKYVLDGLTLMGHQVSGGSAPTIAAGAAADATATVTISGNDQAGLISITAAGTPTTLATLATITFNKAYASAPTVVILTPANQTASLQVVAARPWVDFSSNPTTTSFAIKSGTTALVAGSTYKWWYLVIG